VPFNLMADHIDKTKNQGKIECHSNLKPYGKADVSILVYPKNRTDFDLNYHLIKIPITLFNPYMVTATSFPFDRGSLELKGSWDVKNGSINSKNRLTLIDPRVGKRQKKRDTRWLPIPLAFALLRERGNVIDYDIPIHGNLNKPRFNFWDPVLDVLVNLFIKPPTIPYGIHVRNVENKLEKSINIKWALHSCRLASNTEKFMEDLVAFLEKNEDSQLNIQPNVYQEKEEEYLLLFEARKRYYLQIHHKRIRSFTSEDSIEVEKIASKDPGFLVYLNKNITDSLLFTVQHKSLNVIGEKALASKFSLLKRNRKNHFLSYFPKNLWHRLVFLPSKKVIPFNGQSLYEISYKGEIPESLVNEYKKYNDLNDDLIRENFKKKRKFRDIFF